MATRAVMTGLSHYVIQLGHADPAWRELGHTSRRSRRTDRAAPGGAEDVCRELNPDSLGSSRPGNKVTNQRAHWLQHRHTFSFTGQNTLVRVWGGTADITGMDVWNVEKVKTHSKWVRNARTAGADSGSKEKQRKELASVGIPYKVIKANNQISSEQDPGGYSVYQSSNLEAGRKGNQHL